MKYSYLEDVLFLKIKCFSPSTISSFRKRPNGAAARPTAGGAQRSQTGGLDGSIRWLAGGERQRAGG